MAIPKINSAHGSDTRNILNRAIDLINVQGKSIQDLVAEGQLTPTQYAELIKIVNALISKGDVTFDDIDINKGKLLPKHLSEEVLEMVTGNAPVNAVPADGSITTKKYAERSIVPSKISFMEKTRNLFDGNYVDGGMGLSGNDMRISLLPSIGGIVAIIPIEANKTYTIKVHEPELSDVFRVGVHNSAIPEGQGYIPMDRFVFQSTNLKQHTFTNNANGKFLAVQTSSKKSLKPSLQVELGEFATGFIEGLAFKKSVIPKEDKKEDKAERNLGKHIFSNTFKRRSVGTEKSVITELMNSEKEGVFSNGELLEGTKRNGLTSFKMNVTAGQTRYIQRNIPPEESVEHIHTIGVSIKIQNPTEHNALIVTLYGENGDFGVTFDNFRLNADGDELKIGWNEMRTRSDYNDNLSKKIGKITSVRFAFLSESTSDIEINNVWVESFEKAKLIFVHDGGYQAFFNKGEPGYYDLEERGLPVTIASIPFNIYDEENTRFISGEKLKELSLVNNNEISIHSYAGEDAIATNTPEQMYQESLNALSLLKANGHEVIWRAAFFRNTAPGAAGAKPLFDAYAFNGSHSMVEALEGFPFTAPYNVRRFQLHKRTNETLDLWFEKLKTSRAVWVVYTHNVSDAGGDISLESWEYFLQKVDTALSEGWLEGATVKSLMSAY